MAVPDLSKELNTGALRAEQVAKDEDIRFENISKKVLEVLTKEKVTTAELPRVMKSLTGLINKKFDEATLDQVMDL